MISCENIQEAAIIHLGKDKAYIGKEDDLQISCARLLAYCLPDVLAFHVPNGGTRRKREGVKFKKMGVLPGVSDFLFLESRKNYSGLVVELKVKGGKLQPSQKIFLMNCIARNYKTVVCWNVEAFKDVLGWYFNKRIKP